jgi:iron complex transport system substrate-binding protein
VREGWAELPAVRDGELHEVKSALILQPGPAAVSDGLAALRAIVDGWAQRQRSRYNEHVTASGARRERG